ncbi:alpha-ketoglutarate decarboxylase [Galbibacter mesophilus]|uniref:alpha-ketoglutarate decarboxylase n=1 Tax=Galbibacter mesophilus TaxID=379069 RepID=UPI00191D1ECA|nr:alpha-ketoglutarate decarboxylase [Galbibacter mesophilus]MCM5662564.1 alpha-ketoglutarate decarboxylase [Galbibacter mesophilus]
MHIYNSRCFKKYIVLLFVLGITNFAHAQVNAYNQKSDFWSQVRFGGAFGLSFGSDFFSATVSPSAIYQITPQFATGVGIDFTYANAEFYTATVFGGSVLTFYNPIRQLQLSAEFEQLKVYRSLEIENGPDQEDDYWYPALFLGIGYTSGPVTIGMQADVLYDENKSIYASPFMPFIRFYF